MDETPHTPPLEGVAPEAYDGRPLASLVVAGAVAGVLGVVASLALGAGTKQFYFSWLTAYVYFLSLALGGLFFVLVLFVCRAGWAVAVRRISENVMATLPIFAVLFIPVWLGRHELYEWMNPEVVEKSPLLRGKTPYLNQGFFQVRALVYFVSWSALAVYFSSRSERQDATGEESITRRLQAVAAPGIIVFSLTVTFASIDWILSLEPEWTSTMFGVYYFAGLVLGFLAFLVLAIVLLQARGSLTLVTDEHLHDLGKLLFGFTVFWAYITFSQYLLIWYANIPEETIYYMHRSHGSWPTLALVLGLGHFAFPFFFFMPHAVKRRPVLLALGSAWVLLMHYLDIYWAVMPYLHPEGVRIGLMDVATLLAVGGFFVAAFARAGSRRALVPVRDPRLPESLSFENV